MPQAWGGQCFKSTTMTSLSMSEHFPEKGIVMAQNYTCKSEESNSACY